MHRLIYFLDGLEMAIGNHYSNTLITPPPGIEERTMKSITAAAGRSMSPIHHRAPPAAYKMSAYHRLQDKEAPPTSTRPPTSSISR
jgi:hypothetical protein